MKTFRNIAIILFISIIITFIFDFVLGGTSWKNLFLNILYGFIIGSGISISGFISKYIARKKSIKTKPVETFVVIIVLVSIYITFIVFLINGLWYKFISNENFSEIYSNQTIIVTSLVTVLIGLVIFFIILSRHYLKIIIDKEAELSEIKQAALKAKYEALKLQINPHFLFNSLNSLSSLIAIDTEKAEEFTSKLAQIYRYVIDNYEEEVVNLKNELNFIKDYLYLQTIRFSKDFEYNINVEKNSLNKFIIPFAIQIVIENIFKHNKISKENKILIEIESKKDYLIIKHNVNKIENNKNENKTGLKNITERYAKFTDIKCEFILTDKYFTAKLPLLKES
jgi:sensor histidine kinase YesM